LQSQLSVGKKGVKNLMAKKQEVENELKAKEAELDTVTLLHRRK
jgi:hypothetical protein